MMRPRVVSIIGSTAFAGHESWLMERLEVDLELDETQAKYYARFVLSSLIQPDAIDPHREKELFVYNNNKPSPNSSGYDDLGGLYMDTRTPEEISISELQLASCAPIDHVTKLVGKLGRRLELSKRKRRNSETSEASVISSQSSTSSYEAEFPQLPSRQVPEPDTLLSKSLSWIRRKSLDKQFRFAFKNPTKVRRSSSTAAFPSLPTLRCQKSPTKCTTSKIPKDPELNKSLGGKSAHEPSPKDKRKRKRNRKKKKKSNAESTAEYKNMATYENFDHFSMDQALNFVKSLSGQSDDVNIWTNVVKEQHVKYLNGTFYFTPRDRSSSSSSKSESAKSYKTKFFLEHDESSPPHATRDTPPPPVEPLPAEIDKTIRKPIKCDDGLSHAARIANRMAEIIIEEPDDIFWSDRQPMESLDRPLGDLTWPVISDTLLSPPVTTRDSWTIW